MMAEPAFSPEVRKALDAYAVPPLPQGFADRLMVRIEAGDTGTSEAALPASPRSLTNSPWRRSSRIVGSVAIFSLATATAAAAGVFGDPVYVPGVSEALVEAKIVEAPKAAARSKPGAVAQNKTSPDSAVLPPQETGSTAIVNRVTELRKDPDFAKLPPRQRLRVAGDEVRQMVRSGEANRENVRTAVRELAENADPATKEAWRKAAADRRERRIERRERFRDATPEERAALRSALRERREARQEQIAPNPDPAIQ